MLQISLLTDATRLPCSPLTKKPLSTTYLMSPAVVMPFPIPFPNNNQHAFSIREARHVARSLQSPQPDFDRRWGKCALNSGLQNFPTATTRGAGLTGGGVSGESKLGRPIASPSLLMQPNMTGGGEPGIRSWAPQAKD